MRFQTIFFCFTLTVLLVLCHDSSQTMDYYYPNDENCGMTEENPDDMRTFSPWTVAIFVRKNLSSPFRYFLTGSLCSATTVMTAFGGSFGQPSITKNANRSYRVASPSHFLVVAGLSSTDLNDVDEFSQMANVSYILPYSGKSGSEEYHLVMLRLASPMNLTTPYVRSICQPYGVVPAFHALGYKGRYSDILTYGKNIEPSFISGFNGPLNETGPQKLARFSVTSSNDALCLNTYKYYYRSQPDEIFCLIVNPDGGIADSACMGHGSLKTFMPRPQSVAGSVFFFPEPRFYSSGLVTSIPRKDRGQCDIHTVYYAHSFFIQDTLDWIKLNIICSPQTYPCRNGTCIPVDKVCDGKKDCSSNEDEDPVYCKATNRCKKKDAYQCGLEGKCINSVQVGDGVQDCPSGSDEFPEVIAAKTTSQKQIKSGKKVLCPALQPPKGVTATCSHPQLGDIDCSKSPPGTQTVMSCSKHFKPLSRTNLITMKCYDDKAWKPYRTFSCQPECGQIPKLSGSTAQKEFIFPWNARIVVENSDGSLESKCGATLLELNILITAAHCTSDEQGTPFEPSYLKVALNPSSNETNTQKENKDNDLYDVAEIRIPENYDPETLRSDISIIKLTKPVTYSDTVKPVCYLNNKFARAPVPDSLGVVTTVNNSTSGNTLKQGKNSDLVVLLDDRCDSISSDSFCVKSSAGGVACGSIGGAGLVFPIESDEDMVTYLLKGVFQNVEGQEGCERDLERIYELTHLDDHSEWILLNLQNITNTAV